MLGALKQERAWLPVYANTNDARVQAYARAVREAIAALSTAIDVPSTQATDAAVEAVHRVRAAGMSILTK
jgi:uncharacterized protein HemX